MTPTQHDVVKMVHPQSHPERFFLYFCCSLVASPSGLASSPDQTDTPETKPPSRLFAPQTLTQHDARMPPLTFLGGGNCLQPRILPPPTTLSHMPWNLSCARQPAEMHGTSPSPGLTFSLVYLIGTSYDGAPAPLRRGGIGGLGGRTPASGVSNDPTVAFVYVIGFLRQYAPYHPVSGF